MQKNASGGMGETWLHHHIVLHWVSPWSQGLGGTHRVSGCPLLQIWSLVPIFSPFFSDPNSSSYAVDHQMSSVTRVQKKNLFRCYRAPVKVTKLALCHFPRYSSSVLGTNAESFLESHLRHAVSFSLDSQAWLPSKHPSSAFLQWL